jgi:hypothetical protein
VKMRMNSPSGLGTPFGLPTQSRVRREGRLPTPEQHDSEIIVILPLEGLDQTIITIHPFPSPSSTHKGRSLRSRPRSPPARNGNEHPRPSFVLGSTLKRVYAKVEGGQAQNPAFPSSQPHKKPRHTEARCKVERCPILTICFVRRANLIPP